MEGRGHVEDVLGFFQSLSLIVFRPHLIYFFKQCYVEGHRRALIGPEQ